MRFILFIIIFVVLTAPAFAASQARIKDVVNFEGIRDNMLVGYGLVVGLNRTGDRVNNNKFTQESLVSFLERLGVNTRGENLRPQNVAAVTITATLPAFARGGSRVDVTVSALGDAQSLQGGTLLATPLYGADGQVYAVSQGAVAIGGFQAGGDGATVVKGVPTNGYIANGAIVEREIDFALNDLGSLNVSMRNPDITTAHNVADAINGRLGRDAAKVLDPTTVKLTVPPEYKDNVIGLLADVEALRVDTDQVARVVIDEASGTVVIGENVKIDTVAIAQGNLVVQVNEEALVAQPGPFAPQGAQTAVVPRADVAVDEGEGSKLAVLEEAATLRDLVDGLNALGVGPRDLITILQSVKAAGALQAEITAR